MEAENAELRADIVSLRTCAHADDDESVKSIGRRLRRHAKRMGRERLAVLLLQALERDLGAGVVGFRLR